MFPKIYLKKNKNWTIFRTKIHFLKSFFLSMGTQEAPRKWVFIFLCQRFKKYSLFPDNFLQKILGLEEGSRKIFFSTDMTWNPCLLFIFIKDFNKLSYNIKIWACGHLFSWIAWNVYIKKCVFFLLTYLFNWITHINTRRDKNIG